jgi:hypothetical protein
MVCPRQLGDESSYVREDGIVEDDCLRGAGQAGGEVELDARIVVRAVDVRDVEARHTDGRHQRVQPLDRLRVVARPLHEMQVLPRRLDAFELVPSQLGMVDEYRGRLEALDRLEAISTPD